MLVMLWVRRASWYLDRGSVHPFVLGFLGGFRLIRFIKNDIIFDYPVCLKSGKRELKFSHNFRTIPLHTYTAVGGDMSAALFARHLSPGLGFALQDRGALFNMEETTADVYDAGKVRLLFVFTVTFRANPDHNHLTHVNTSLFFVTFLQNWKAAVSHHHSRLRDKGRRAVAQLWSHGWKHAAPRPCADHQQHGRFRHGGAGKWRRGALLPYRQLTADWKRDARRRIDDA